MKRQVIFLAVIFLTIFVFSGCSGGVGSPVLPGLPEIPDQGPSAPSDRSQDEQAGLPSDGITAGSIDPLLMQQLSGGQDGHHLLYMYDLRFNPETFEIEAAQERSSQKHWEVSDYVLPPECADCVKAVVVGLDPVAHIYDVNVTLKNPTPLKAYDVKGILFIGSISDPRDLVNVDNYTQSFDPQFPPNLNPFKVFRSSDPKREFPPGSQDTLMFQLYFPQGASFNVPFAVDISWPKNQKDPYDIINQEVSGPLDTTGVKEVTVSCDVLDWQADISKVTLDLAPLGGLQAPMSLSEGNTFTAQIKNTNNAPAGAYKLQISAVSLVDLSQLYDYVTVVVEATLNNPPKWKDNIVGITGAVPGDGFVEIQYGIAIDPDIPVLYAIYASTSTPIDFGSVEAILNPTPSPYIYSGLENGQEYHFAVRAMDGLGLADSNTVELAATPSLSNNAPTWVDTVGITSAVGGPGFVSVYFGEAIDPDEPVSYTVYYDDLLGFDWATANKINGNTSSPVKVPGLVNGQGYVFGVRARDGLGLEDTNIVLKPGMPNNLPPQWEVFPGGILNAIPGDGQVEVVFGNAIDPDSQGGDVTYNVYYSTEEFQTQQDYDDAGKKLHKPGSPVIISPLPNGVLFYFAVRAEDEFGLEEKNPIYLPATPSNLPPIWDETIGVQDLVPGNGQITVEYGTASDPDLPVTYKVYYGLIEFDFWNQSEVMVGETGSPSVIPGLINDLQYFVGVRAADGVGLEEHNNVILSATPSYNNDPPVWDSTTGIVNVTPGDKKMTITYGTASDPDAPVSYTVYYSTSTPINFGAASKLPDPSGSPTVVPNLTNGQTYHFAVRAKDSLGLEETNTVELPGTPVNLPPTWLTTTGIVDVQANDGYALVYFGTASDASPPVTYNVYWDETSPIDFGTANVSTGNTSSPVYLGSLTNGQQLWFAVRAEDNDGLEDTNTNELTATPAETPPVWDDTIGIQGVFPAVNQVTVTYGTASDADVPVTYNVYYSLSTPINFGTASVKEAQPGSPTSVSGLTDGLLYHFAVRARDATGMEDSNIIELAATPGYDNSPPEWDGLIHGIEDAVAGDHTVTVTYGTASDPDLPVKYNVYWSTSSPLNFATAQKKIGEPGSPSLITGLTNAVPLFFAVRAMDGLGLEETNTNEDSATPQNEPPVWDDTIGITDILPGSQKVTVYYGTASDPDLPVTFRVYYQKDGPIDWTLSPYVVGDGSPTDVGSLLNGSVYSFGVRAVDGMGLAETNTVHLQGSPNLPPQWTTTVGVTDVLPGLGQAVVKFGAATDVDGVTFNVYYSQISPMNFATASKITGVIGSPHTVKSLNPGFVYYFAVRAIDSLGLEDDNINEASAEIWFNPTAKWSYPSGSSVLSSPTWLDVDTNGTDDVIIGGQDSLMKAINGNSGGLAWSYPAGDFIDSSACLANVNGGVLDVVVGSNDGSLYAIDGSTGAYIWDYPTGGDVVSSPATGDINNDGNLDLAFGSLDSNLYVIRVSSGAIVWSKPAGGQIKGSPAIYDVDSDGDLEVFVGSADGKMYCFNGDGAGEKWHYSTSQPVSVSPVIGDVEGDGDKECIFISEDGFLYVVDAATGAFRWNYNLTSDSGASPTLGDVNEDGALDIAIGTADGKFRLINGASHTAIWTISGLIDVESTAVMADLSGDGILDVLFGTENGRLFCLDGIDGQNVFFTGASGAIRMSPMVHDIDNDGLLEVVFATASGAITALDTSTPIPSTADIIWPKFRRTVTNNGVL